jgi:hypothetical protein
VADKLLGSQAAAEGKPIIVWTGSGGAPACHT